MWAMHSYALFLSQPKVPVELSFGIPSPWQYILTLMPMRRYYLLFGPCATFPRDFGGPGINVGSRDGICGGAPNERDSNVAFGLWRRRIISTSGGRRGPRPLECQRTGTEPGVRWIPRNQTWVSRKVRGE
ncbi:hypothetical protein M404DRAFT_997986 [Pisolithus tinctorius Marx 270]|uniref:Uncharacterized protein n=1 Tax=Pisolithus tinctorius Marx 270 TaxID=870435 RepID=A0A0C3JFK4_PISTI|nr:hypothetical protein M404DRAFT_997986 [Pisolithus tinctorius Marx 270]